MGFLTVLGNDSLAQFRDAMRDLGYLEGRDIRIERRSSGGRSEPLPKLASELVQLKVDVIYATGPAAVRAAHDATHSIPVVAFDLETDPVAAGLVDSLSRPGGNLTGLFLDLPGLAAKWLDLLHQAAPDRGRVYVLWDSTTGDAQLRAVRLAAHQLGLEVDLVTVRDRTELEHALSETRGEQTHGLLVLSSPLMSGGSGRIAEFALRARVPGISAFRAFAEGGGLLSYGPNLMAFRRFSATYIDKILKGARAAELPIQQPSVFELIVNLRTAKALGLAMPRTLLLGADQIIR